MGWKLHFPCLAKIIVPHWLGGVHSQKRSELDLVEVMRWFQRGCKGLARQWQGEGSWNSQEGDRASGEGDLVVGVCFTPVVFALRRNLSPQPPQASLPLKQKREQSKSFSCQTGSCFKIKIQLTRLIQPFLYSYTLLKTI